MSSHVALLRAINVAGHARVKMTDVKRAFSAAGCGEVRTFIQSGNVLFEAPDKDTTTLFQRVQVNVDELLGTKVTVMFRTLPDLERMVREDPFRGVAGESDVKLFVSFLSGKPQSKPELVHHLPDC